MQHSTTTGKTRQAAAHLLAREPAPNALLSAKHVPQLTSLVLLHFFPSSTWMCSRCPSRSAQQPTRANNISHVHSTQASNWGNTGVLGPQHGHKQTCLHRQTRLVSAHPRAGKPLTCKIVSSHPAAVQNPEKAQSTHKLGPHTSSAACKALEWACWCSTRHVHMSLARPTHCQPCMPL